MQVPEIKIPDIASYLNFTDELPVTYMKHILFFLFLFFISILGYAQVSVKGIVKNDSGKPLANASVSLFYKADKDSLKTLSNNNGSFIFPGVKSKHVALLVTYIGYKPFLGSYDYTNLSGEQFIENIQMIPGINTLDNITLDAAKIQVKEDTVSYLVDSAMYRKNDNVEEVLKKLPGVQVDKDGTVTAQGKQVTKVKVNGKEFFGGDVTTATREINADMVDRLQIIDDYGDQAAFTGIKDGDPTKTLNIQLKKDRNRGYFGNLTAGAGTDKRYLSSLSINKFNNSQQISVLGNINNTNASLFNFGSIGGSMGNMISSMARGMGIGQGGGGIASAIGNFGNSDGIGTTKSIGINYRDEWGKKISAYGSYSYSQKGITTIKNITEQNPYLSPPSINTRNSTDYTVADNHRVSFNIEYKIDSFNYLKFNPSLVYRETAGSYAEGNVFVDGSGKKLNVGAANKLSDSKIPSFNGNLLYNHRFAKRGRTLSLNLSAGHSSTDGNEDYQSLNTFFMNGDSININNDQNILQDNQNHNYGIRASYTEPISRKRNLEFNYAYNNQSTGNDLETFRVDPVTGIPVFVQGLSNIYDNVYITNRFGLNFRTTEKKYNYTIGFAAQPASIQSNSVTDKNSYTQHLVNYYPVIRFAYNFSRSRSFNINYNGSSSQPGYTQLRPVADSSNLQNIVTGNPFLKPEFTNTFSTRYNNFDFISGNVFFGNISVSFTNDKIVTNTISFDSSARQETRYLNSDGFYTVLSFYNISRPIQNRKFVFNLGGNITYNNNVSFINGQKNTGRNWLLGQRFATDIKIKKWLETSVGINYMLNSTSYTIKTQALQNLNTNSWTLSHSSRFFLKYDFIISYDMDKAINSGYSGNVNADPFIINATLEKQLFKKKNASIKLQAYDILNENISISRSVTGNYITDTRANKLGRYFMMSFVFRLNNFNAQQQMPGGGGMHMMRPPGM